MYDRNFNPNFFAGITGFDKPEIVDIFSIHHQSSDIWFSVSISFTQSIVS